MTNASFVTTLFLFFIGLSLAGIILMLTLIGKKGDERKNHIIMKAGFNSFLIFIGVLILNILETMVRVLIQQQPIRQINPFTLLTVAAIVFLIQLAHLNKKYSS